MKQPSTSTLNIPLLKPLLLVVLSLWLGLHPSSASPLLTSNQLVFVNLDHAPMGACSTIAYGWSGQPCGVGTSSGVYPYWSDNGGGVLLGVGGNSGIQLMPFLASPTRISTNATFFPGTNIQRTLTPCTDEYNVDTGRLMFTHYTPA